MATITRTVNAKGDVVYKVRVSCGRGRRVCRNWKPVPGWSARTIERELNKFAADLENQMASGEIVTRQEAKAQQAEAEAEAAKLKTLKEYSENVFMKRIAIDGSENTRSSYQANLDKHIYPALGDFLISEITPAMISAFLLELKTKTYSQPKKPKKKKGKNQEEAAPPKKYSHATIVKVYTILSGIFTSAFNDDTIAISPMLKVKKPSPRKDEEIKEAADEAYTASELNRILKLLSAEPLKWKAYVFLVADTGVRRGEACGIQWEDIDFDNSTITFHRNLQYTPGKGVYVDTNKNRRVRSVDVGEDTLEYLRQLRQKQAESCISKWVFTQDESPEPMHPQSPTRYFKKLEKRYGIKDFHPHKLRHTFASVAITNGADVASVSEQLGHANAAFTLRQYTHSNEEKRQEVGRILRNAIREAD